MDDTFRERLALEQKDKRMMKDMFAASVPPNIKLFMKPEYREKFADALKANLPSLFPTVKIEANNVEGLVFKSPKTKLYFPYDSSGNFDVLIFYMDVEQGGWLTQYDYDEMDGVEDTYMGDENDPEVLNILRQIYETSQQLQPLTLKRSEIGWSDPITMAPIRSGDKIIRLNKDNRFIFDKKSIERFWATTGQKNPLTNQPVTSQQIESFIATITEDAGAEPVGGRKKRRKTLRRKNLRSSRKNK